MKHPAFFLYYLIGTLLLSTICALCWFFSGLDMRGAAETFFSVLFATLPLAYFVTAPIILRRTRKRGKAEGIEIGSDDALLLFAETDTLCASKNGVITSGHPYISGLIGEGVSKGALLGLAGSVERASVHPVGRAIYATAKNRAARMPLPAAAQEHQGLGAEALIARAPVRVGKSRWLLDEGVEIRAGLLTQADQIARHGATPVFVSNGPYCRGIIVITDDIPDGTTMAVHKLRRMGVATIMLTGENRVTARTIQRLADLDDARADLTPAAKAREIQLMRTKGKTIAMAGSGAYDAPALREVDIRLLLERPEGEPGSPLGVEDDTAEGKKNTWEPPEPEVRTETAPPPASARERIGSPEAESEEAAQEKTAPPPVDITIRNGTLQGVADALALCRQARSRIRTGNRLALAAYVILTVLAAGLYLLLTGTVLPPYAVLLANIIVTILVFLLALRA